MMTKYFLGGGFARVNDKYVVALGRLIQLYDYLGLIGLTLFIILFFYSILTVR
jgi:hypothetical protein